MRILVFELPQAEGAARCDDNRFGQQGLRMDRRQRLARAQVALAIREQGMAGLCQRGAEADGRHRVLQGPAAADVHVDVTAGDGGNVQLPRQLLQRMQASGVVGAAVQFDGQPGAMREFRLHPMGFIRPWLIARNPQCQQAVVGAFEILAQGTVRSLPGAASRDGDQLA